MAYTTPLATKPICMGQMGNIFYGSSMAATSARPQTHRSRVLALAQLASSSRDCAMLQPLSRRGCSALKAERARRPQHSRVNSFALTQLPSPQSRTGLHSSLKQPAACGSAQGPLHMKQLLCPQAERDCNVPREPAAWAAASDKRAQSKTQKKRRERRPTWPTTRTALLCLGFTPMGCAILCLLLAQHPFSSAAGRHGRLGENSCDAQLEPVCHRLAVAPGRPTVLCAALEAALATCEPPVQPQLRSVPPSRRHRVSLPASRQHCVLPCSSPSRSRSILGADTAPLPLLNPMQHLHRPTLTLMSTHAKAGCGGLLLAVEQSIRSEACACSRANPSPDSPLAASTLMRYRTSSFSSES